METDTQLESPPSPSTPQIISADHPQHVAVISPPLCVIQIQGRNFTFTAMPEVPAMEWLSLRLSRHMRQLLLFRKITALVVGAQFEYDDLPDGDDEFKPSPELAAARVMHYKAARDKRDALLDDSIKKEWVLLSKTLCAKALKLDASNIHFLQSLSDPEKIAIIEVQDKMNGLDILKHLAKVEEELKKKGMTAVPMSKKFAKMAAKKKKKKKK